MISEAREQEIYSAVFRVLLGYGDDLTLPVSLTGLCAHLGIQLHPVSKSIVEEGFSAEFVFEYIWHNRDGVAFSGPGGPVIDYNDFADKRRARFTIGEEIGHCILGHVNDDRFDVMSPAYDQRTYARYEVEARIAAGLILCQPQFFYREDPRYLNPRTVAYLCDVSDSCAKTRVDILMSHRQSIESNPLYAQLPQPAVLRPFWRADQHTLCEPRSVFGLRPRYARSAILVDGP